MATGLTLSGRYELRTRLGAGGAGAVWRGFDTTLQREVAIKLIALDGPGLGVDIDAPISRFRREARAVAQLNHPNIVQAYDFGVHDDVAFLVMELIEGASLSEHLRRRRAAGLGGFDEAQVIHIARQVCAGLAVAHRARLVHRDMKPSNLMVADANGRVKIVDFGIARIEEQSRLTRTGSYLGTLPYVAPEQMDAEPIDGRADLYSLACVLFELMTGRSPYDASTPMQWMSAHQKATPAPLRRYAPAASAEMESLLQRMLAKNPSYRPPDADAVSEALAQVGARLAQRAPTSLRYGPPGVPLPTTGTRGVAQAPRASGVAAPPIPPPARFPARPPSGDPPPRPPGITVTPAGNLPVAGRPPTLPGSGMPPFAAGPPAGPGPAVSPAGPGAGGDLPVRRPGERLAGDARRDADGHDESHGPADGAPPGAAAPSGAGAPADDASPAPVSPAAARETPVSTGAAPGGRPGASSAPDSDGPGPAAVSRAGAHSAPDPDESDERSPASGARASMSPPAGPAGIPTQSRAGDDAPVPDGYVGASAVFTGSASMSSPDSAAHATSSPERAAHAMPADGDLWPDRPGDPRTGTRAATGLPIGGTPATGSQVSGPPGSGSPVSGPPPTGSQVSGPPGSGSQVSGPPATGSQVSGPPGAGSQVSGPPATGSQVSGPPGAGSQVSGPPATGSQGGGPKSAGSAPPSVAATPAAGRAAAAAPAGGPGSTAGHDGPGEIDVAADVAGPTVPLLRSKTQPTAVPRQAGPGRQSAGVARHSRPTAPVPPAVPISPTMRRGQRPPGPPGLPAVTGGGPAPTRARRLGQNTAIVAVLVAAIVLVATVVAALSHPRARGRQTTPPSPPAALVPAVGDCYAGGWASAIDADAASVWSASGDTSPVRCGNMHAFEVVAIGTLNVTAPPAATSEAVRETYATCVKAADNYLGGAWRGAYAWLGVAVPDADAWGRGARWAACVLRPTANWQGAGISATGSVKDGLRGTRPAAITCFQSATGVPVGCDVPHSDEAVGLATLPSGRWPGQAALYDAYGDSCQAIAAHFLGFATVKAWTSNALGWKWWIPSQEQWELGNHTAVCTVNTTRKDGLMTGSVRNLRNGVPK